MRRAIATLLAVLIIGSALPAPARAAGLWDIGGHWAQGAISAGLADGYINGFPDGSFRPDQAITRAEFFKLLVGALQLEARPGSSAPYAPWHWAVKEGQIQAAVAGGLLNPPDYAHWVPLDTPIPRREILLAAVRAVGKEGLVGSGRLMTPDAARYPDWLQAWATVAMADGLLGGYEDGSLGLERTATRAEALVIVQRILERVTMRLTPAQVGGLPNQYRYPAPGEPTWAVAVPVMGRPEFSDGTQSYRIDRQVSRFNLLPAPGQMAWLLLVSLEAEQGARTGQGTGAVQLGPYTLWRLQNGQATLVAQSSEPLVKLAVGADGRLWFSQGDDLLIAKPDGQLSKVLVGEPLRFGEVGPEGDLWAVGTGALYRISPTGGLVKIAGSLSDLERVRHLTLGPDGSVWLFQAGGAGGERVEAVRLREGRVTQRGPLLSARFGGIGQPVQAATLGRTGEAGWVIVVDQGAGGERSLFRFDLGSGASARQVPPRWVGPGAQLLPAPDGGALLQDSAGKFWRILP